MNDESVRLRNRLKMRAYMKGLRERRAALPNYVPDSESQICHDCGAEKPIDSFIVVGRRELAGKRRLDKRCVTCRSKRGASWRAKSPENFEKYRNHQREMYWLNRKQNQERNLISRLRRFGVTLQWYSQTLKSQGGKCAICGTSAPSKRRMLFCIDHRHSCCGTKTSCDKCRRGLLCNKCNLRLGILEIDDWMVAATKYLRHYAS